MSDRSAGADSSPWASAARAASLLAVDPVGLGGVALRAFPGPVRDRWLALLRGLLPTETPWRRIPLGVADDGLMGGLDLSATLRAGRPVAARGLLAEADGGMAIMACAERVSSGTAARIAAALDAGEVALERDGLTLRAPARFGVVALDEGLAEDEMPPAALLDRLAFRLELAAIGARDSLDGDCGPEAISAARALLPAVEVPPPVIEALSEAAAALGIASLRATLLAVRAARAAAALEGRTTVSHEDAAEAGRLVLAPRATALPGAEAPAQDEARADAHEGNPAASDETEPDPSAANPEQSLAEIVLTAAEASIPTGLLAQLRAAGESRARAPSSGRAGQVQRGAARGRPSGVRRGDPRSGARLNLVETLRAAAPWQRLRRAGSGPDTREGRVDVRRDDFRVTRFKRRAQTTTIFAVDASGSSAFQRLAEVKGAVELLLAECYVRRDRVALLAFRGRGAEVLLAPTRSLVRAKRSLAGLPGGGGTPLAAGIDAALALADAVRRRGETPVIVLLTDGRANVGRDGIASRARASDEAAAAARRLRGGGITVLLVDTSPQPQAPARVLAGEMGAQYLPLPHANAAALSTAVRAAAGPARGEARR